MNLKYLRTSILVCGFFVTQPLSAQTGEVPIEPAENSLQSGKWAVQFQIDQYFTLTSFQGTMLSLKRHLSDESALRLGASATYATGDANSDEVIYPVPIQEPPSSESNSTSSGFVLNLQYLYYPNPQDHINLFLGTGPLIQLSHSSSETKQFLNTSERLTTSDRNTWYLGVSGAVGVEWFATRWLSFHGEYGASFQYVTSEQTERISETGSTTGEVVTERSSDSDTWRFAPLSVKFGLSAYF